SKGLGLGIAYRRFLRYDLGDDIRSLDLSMSIRPINHLGFAFIFSDVNTPAVTYDSTVLGNYDIPSRTEDAPKRFIAAMTLRPFGDDRVSLGAEMHYMHGDRQVFDPLSWSYETDSFHRTDVHAMATVMVTDGVSLRTRFVSEGLRSSEIPNSYYLDASLIIDSDRFPFGLSASPRFKLHPGEEDGFEGMSMAVRLSGDVPPSIPLILAPSYIVPIEFEESLDNIGLANLLAKLERIRLDKSVDMVLLKPHSGALTLSQAMEVRHQVQALNSAGKKTTCYIEDVDAAGYLSCSAANSVWVNPAGGIRMAGLSTQAVYFKTLLDKIGVQADIVRIGEYKSAPEAFTETGPTEPSAGAMNRYMDSVYGKLVYAVEKDRNFKDSESARKAIESGPFVSSEALAFQLADKIVGADELEAAFENVFAGPVYIDDKYGNRPLRSRTYLDSPSVAILHIEGDIVDGESRHLPLFGIHNSGSKTVIEQIREIKEDSRIQAVVVRINSPGGSALASDMIWRELMLLREEKPVVASMGAVAASGAYYIASAADVIFAESTTLTGSIGIYYGKADISGLLEKVGISTTTFSRGEHADLQSWTRPYTTEERKKLTGQLRKFYNLFLERVSEGRGDALSKSEVDRLGRGRIWSGADAKHHRLVDRLGGYQEALDHARGLGHVSKGTPVAHYPEPARDMMTAMAKRMGLAQGSAQTLLTLARETRETMQAALPFTMSNHAAPQARLPFALIDTP
ncbi:MAG: signal peptide peptidase SppA, partial [Deltaproteobacteria bacterium]|nr:signal peptide peptidase SppA [Deltaproteobacteria bacterium]MBN2672038.1 signal peptide peptidase SppA [Deltaproteobacteria bacterium]